MIIIVEQSAEVVTFENTRSGDRFHAWLKEGTQVWVVTRQGSLSPAGHADIWGRAEQHASGWFGFAGNLPDTAPVPWKTRDQAFEWITNDREDAISEDS